MFRIVAKTRLVAALLAVVLSSATLSGCYGSFNLTKKVYQFNGSLGNKWINSLFTFILGAPAYGISATADVVVFNLIEFWTGSNPVAAGAKDFDQKMADGTRVQGVKLDDGRLQVTVTPLQSEAKTVVLNREADGIRATSLDGDLVAKVADVADGRTVMITPKAN